MRPKTLPMVMPKPARYPWPRTFPATMSPAAKTLSDRLRIDDRVGDLAGLLGHEAAPDGVALGPEIFSLVVEARAVAVHHDAERHRIDPRDDAAVELRRASVDRDRVALPRVADLGH